MNSLKHLLIIMAFLLGGVRPASAMFDELSIHVVSFTPADKPDRYTLIFDAETTDYGDLTNLPLRKRHFTVMLRCEPRFCSLDEYREAIRLLRQRIEHSPDVTIGRMAATGWRPVPRKRGVFESVGLRIPRPPAGVTAPTVLMFLHDDRF